MYKGLAEVFSLKEERRKRRKRRSGDSPSGQITLDNSTVLDNASVGALVGNLAVVGGVGSYIFTLTNNASGKYSVSGSQLQVASALSVGADSITVKADNGAGSVLTQNFTITVNSSASVALKADFSLTTSESWVFG